MSANTLMTHHLSGNNPLLVLLSRVFSVYLQLFLSIKFTLTRLEQE